VKWAAVLLLTGCAGRYQPEPVQVPVPVACVAQVIRPTNLLPDSLLMQLPDARLVLALREQQILWRSYAQELEAAQSGCR